MGGKTGLYFVGFNRKDGIVGERDTALTINASDFRGLNRNQTQNAVFVDLCNGHPKQTNAARCLTARYGQTVLSNRHGERSGVLHMKKEPEKRCNEAQPGNIADLVERGGRIRRLMPRECLRLQGFEDSQIDKILAINSDSQAYKQAGNSVTVNVIEAIGQRLRAVDEELKEADAG